MSRPRKSSNLGADIRGDTGAPAISTMNSHSPSPEAPSVRHTQRGASERSGKSHSKRRRARSFFRRWKDTSLKHTWLTPLILLLIILATYAVNPTESNPVHSAIFLSYPNPPETPGGPIMYGKGKKDLAFVGFYTIVLSFTREFIMQRIIRPWGVYCGIKSKAKMARFMEQVYTAIYFALFGPFGLYVMSKTDIWYFNTTPMFEGFPHRLHTADFKAYYLLEASYWAQQAIVLLLLLEKPRKDFKELVAHHIITLALIGLSYRFHFTYIGLAVYITHDISDFFLATSKTLNYLDSVLIGPYFITFIGVWIYMRHYLNLRILWAVLTEFQTVGPFELNWETQQYKCRLSQVITFGLLSALQAVNLLWLFLILRIAKNYVLSDVRKDERSEDEEEEEQEEDQQPTLTKDAQVCGNVGTGTGAIGSANNGSADATHVTRRTAKTKENDAVTAREL
ncbi:longevity-assurance protein [Histoplasma capsulatum G186AR]|uniref:Longevity-assurance protein n=2 Tax=Ajellomyces capsulatus TaxID=5037 RepID=C0NF88_AJECG|nr:longevity-assurance protein [Histoplasma capsulatum G186AR]EEH09909.1 longevity-assurance protein [Histoplasma capsulatum G186AR]KAG5298929.1 longevity-assurance protein [Histoplasma capsulatum]QSS73077.1 longevity-assurance protein [Histoplasma capsulatum G186AR]